MAHFADLTGYTYSKWDSLPKTVNIGWLDDACCFDKANTPDEIAEKLWRFCEYSIGQTRGFHTCNLPGCANLPGNHGPLRASRGRSVLKLGSAEIRVFGHDGRIYAAPNLIYHYVTVHGYKMPDEFVSALMVGPGPESAEYFERLRALGLQWSKTLTEGD